MAGGGRSSRRGPPHRIPGRASEPGRRSDPPRRLSAASATRSFGSGRAWLARGTIGILSAESAGHADPPLARDATPLLTCDSCDVWEHADTIDDRNARPGVLEAFWSLDDWGFVTSRHATHSGADRSPGMQEPPTWNPLTSAPPRRARPRCGRSGSVSRLCCRRPSV
ncbi:MAG: hypothetical protein CL910_06030 [Deltaproteobacteria bacterium]|nr:hypothetical protein [Deltaproteobacteria bacterium]